MFSQAEMERAVIGALVQAQGEGASAFEASDFSGAHRTIFAAIEKLPLGGDWGMPQLAAALPSELVGTLVAAIGSACAPSNLRHYAAMLRRQRQLREIRLSALEIAEIVGPNADPDEIARLAIERFQSIPSGQRDPLAGLKSIGEIMAAAEIVGPESTVATGIPEVDQHAHLAGGTLNVIAARPGGGKSAMMLDWSVRAARQGFQVLLFSLEMSLKDIRRRLWAMFPQGPESVSGLGLWVQEPLARKPPVGHLVAMSAEFCRVLRDRPTLVVVDYLQIVAPNRYWQTRREQVGEVVRELKSLAMCLDVPVIAGAQLGRGVEQRGPKAKPMMSDLKEAGEIEEVADFVALLHRPSAEGTDALLGVAKNRHGRSHFSVSLTFLPETARFVPKASDFDARSEPFDDPSSFFGRAEAPPPDDDIPPAPEVA